MLRAKWVMVVVVLLAAAGIASGPASASDLFPNEIVPAVLHIPGPDEPPLYLDIEFAAAPVLPANLCEARCLTDFRDLDVLLDECRAACTSEI
ncbi:MAG: hypothetical protein ABUT39_28455 [Acidobacteriota bacterium]